MTKQRNIIDIDARRSGPLTHGAFSLNMGASATTRPGRVLKPITVGDIRKAIQGLSDDTPVLMDKVDASGPVVMERAFGAQSIHAKHEDGVGLYVVNADEGGVQYLLIGSPRP